MLPALLYRDWNAVDVKQRGDEWRFRLGERPFAVLLPAIYIPVFIAGIDPSAGLTALNAFGVAFVVGFLWFACRTWVVGITAGTDDVKLTSLLSTYRVPWSEISHFEIGRFATVRGIPRLTTIGLVRRDGTVVCARTFNAGFAPPDSGRARRKFQIAVNDLNRLNLETRIPLGSPEHPASLTVSSPRSIVSTPNTVIRVPVTIRDSGDDARRTVLGIIRVSVPSGRFAAAPRGISC